MMKKMIVLVLISVLCCVLFVGCAQKKESVEINISVPILTMDCAAYPDCGVSNEFIQAAWDKFAVQYEKYDVTLKNNRVNVFDQTDYTANISDAYGTERAPDMTFGGYFAISGYIYDGHVIPLDEMITESIRADFSEATWKLSQGSNGKTYLMPFYSLENILCYNKALFRRCGLEAYISDEGAIQGWSLEEWEVILSALRENLPENHYPMMMYAKNEQGDTHTMIQLRCQGSDFFGPDGLFHLNTEEGIAGLQWLKDNYDKGYYPSGCEDLEISDCSQLFVNGQIAIYIWNSSLISSLEDLDLGYVNFPGVDANGVNSNWITGFMAFDNGDEKKTEVVKDFLKFIYETPELMDYSTSGLPCSKSVMDRWGDQLPMAEALSANDAYSVDFTANNPNWAGVRQAFWPHIHALLTGQETAAEAAAGLDADCNTAITSVSRTLHD
ncbi:MAG: hypothetical protein Q4E89_07235 [Eubacteriales bacterium]|nr:hypothetical protein [Eubacteriales bacterium]